MNRILIIEDHPTLLRSLRRGLEALGYGVVTAETGEEGYHLAVTRSIDGVVLDLMLPGRSGFEILYDLRANGFDRPILILTAKDSAEDRRRAQDCGANGYLIKPFAFQDLVAQLGDMLSTAGGAPLTAEKPSCTD